MGSAAASHACKMSDGGVDAANFALKLAQRTLHDCAATLARRIQRWRALKMSYLACIPTSTTAGGTAWGVGGCSRREQEGRSGGSVGRAEPTHPLAPSSERGRKRAATTSQKAHAPIPAPAGARCVEVRCTVFPACEHGRPGSSLATLARHVALQWDLGASASACSTSSGGLIGGCTHTQLWRRRILAAFVRPGR